MPKTRFGVLALVLIGIAPLTVSLQQQPDTARKKSGSGTQGRISNPTGLQTNPEWIKTKYGGSRGPGVDPRPGPMDSILLKDGCRRHL